LQLHELHEHTRLLGLESIKQMIHSASSRSHHITVAISDHMPPTFAFRTLLSVRKKRHSLASESPTVVRWLQQSPSPPCLEQHLLLGYWQSNVSGTCRLAWAAKWIKLSELANTGVKKWLNILFVWITSFFSIIKMICSRRNCMWPRWRTQKCQFCSLASQVRPCLVLLIHP
jgi:hypothetical protein